MLSIIIRSAKRTRSSHADNYLAGELWRRWRPVGPSDGLCRRSRSAKIGEEKKPNLVDHDHNFKKLLTETTTTTQFEANGTCGSRGGHPKKRSKNAVTLTLLLRPGIVTIQKSKSKLNQIQTLPAMNRPVESGGGVCVLAKREPSGRAVEWRRKL